MHVIGTAGHVDHGKSVLVEALTGIDPDRLEEEKARGMTIDLGFAWLTLPSGRQASIVDVPGHEHFIKNMLAGVGGIDLALLVVAADEGVMPQTREHLAILDLLQVHQGIIVLTKKDLVDEEWLELVQEEVQETASGTTLAHAPMVAVSAMTGEGLSELLEIVDRVLAQTPAKRDLERPRLPVDRTFTMAGFGTVVTGTLIDGLLRVGQEVEIAPKGLKARIRGLQVHRSKVETATPGSRVAANLSGVSMQDLERGDVVTEAGWLDPTAVVDVKLRLIPSASRPLPHDTTIAVHLLACQVLGRVRLLDRDELDPGESGWAQIRLDRPVAAVRGDRFIIRNSVATIGGGRIVDVRPRRHRRFHAATLERLDAMERDSAAVLLHLLDRGGPYELRDLLHRAALPPQEARSALERLATENAIVALGEPPDDRAIIFSATGWAETVARLEDILRAYHRQYPLRLGMPKRELGSRLRLASRVAMETIERLADAGAVVRLPDHVVRPTPQQQADAAAFLAALEASPYAPPTDLDADPEIVNMLAGEGKVVPMGEGIVFGAAAYEQMVERIVERTRDQGKITVTQVREMFDTRRKYALALVEHLNKEHILHRVGYDIVLR